MMLYKIMLLHSGRKPRELKHGLTFNEAMNYCSDRTWRYREDGIVWELDIQDDDWEVVCDV